MPKSWLPPPDMKKLPNPAPWTAAEAKDAEYAIRTGLDEMIGYFERKPSAVLSLWGDSIEALMQVTYASANDRAFDEKVRDASRKNLTMLINYHLKRKPKAKFVTCDDFERLLPLAIFAHRLYPRKDPRTVEVTQRTNASMRKCDSLEDAIGDDHHKILADKYASPAALLELYIWALWFIEAELFPAIELPDEAHAYAPALWKYLLSYRLADAEEFPEGAWDEGFIAVADLAPHIAHIPTGTHRFPIYVQDWPRLYQWHRQNFYDVLQVGELDLVASVVDTLRQYGCTAENDVQVRDGTRYLLKVFHVGNDSWTDYRKDGETDANIDDYGLIHYPWTSVLGVRVRKFEEPNAGNIGGLVRRWIPPPR
ncbi:MAG: hypothetical protein ACWGMY_01865 [Hyphomicrobiaceae bacterium]